VYHNTGNQKNNKNKNKNIDIKIKYTIYKLKWHTRQSQKARNNPTHGRGTHSNRIGNQTERTAPPRIQNYTWVIKNRTTGGGGVAILIRNDILPSTRIIDEFEQDDIEALCIKLINPKKDIAIGVFYGLQENNNKEKLLNQFSTLTTQINKLRQNTKILLTGDFNAKLKVNKGTINQEESNNGKLLNLLLKETNTFPASLSMDKGTWTRENEQTEKKNQSSII
jgi:exonuclease III